MSAVCERCVCDVSTVPIPGVSAADVVSVVVGRGQRKVFSAVLCVECLADLHVFMATGDSVRSRRLRDSMDLVLIWSFQHDAWWRPDSLGYTSEESQAGRYHRSAAERIVKGANVACEPGSPDEEIRELDWMLRIMNADDVNDVNAPDEDGES